MTQILIGFVIAFVISMATNWPLTYVLIGVGLGWLLLFRGNHSSGSNLGTAVTNAVVGFFGTTWRLAIATAIFLPLMMLVSRFTSVSPYWSIARIQEMGWPQDWGADIGLPVLLFVCSVMICAAIAMMAARGRVMIAGTIFVLSFIIVFAMMNMPRTAEAVAPKPTARMPAKATQWEKTDQTIAERGVVPTGTTTIWRFLFGQPKPKVEAEPSTAGFTSVQNVKTVQQLPDCPTPCTMEIKEIRDVYTDAEPVYVLPPGWPEEKKVFYSGKGHLILDDDNIREGTWKFWSADPEKVVPIRVIGIVP